MAFKGSLREASLADVCQLLALGFKTGCLSVTDRARFGQIFFDKGRITYARIVNRRDRLGDLLVHDGLLTHEQLAEMLDEQEREPERRLGELLLERAWIDRADLERYVRRQIEGAIFHLFTWSRGSFSFEAGQRTDSADMLFAISAESVLLEAARRIDEWSQIEKKIASLDCVFAADLERVKESGAELTAEQRQLLPLLDGSRSLHDVVYATGLPEFDVGRAVYGLVQAGLAREKARSGGEAGTKAGISEHRNLAVAFYRAAMLEDSEREFRRVIELSPEDTHARLHLGLIALRANRPADAVHELSTLLEEAGPSYPAFINLAIALQRTDRMNDALRALRGAEKSQPGTVAVSLERGIIALGRRQIPEARRRLEEARQRAAGAAMPARWYYFAGLAAALAGEGAEAAALVQEGLGAHPEAPPVVLLAGLVAERHGDLESAEALYNRVVELDPMIVQAHKDLGDVAYRRGAQDLALSLFQRALELAPELGDDTHAKLGNLHYRARNRDAAVRHWKRALELNPGNDAVRNNLEIVAHAGA